MDPPDHGEGGASYVPANVPHHTKLVTLVSGQAGMVSRAQALDCGVTRHQLAWLVTSGRWRRVHLGVYATFTGALTFDARVWAALLRAGRGAVASHQTAAHLDGFCDDPGPVIHVTVPADRHLDAVIAGVRIHYARRLHRTRHPARLPPRTRVEETVLDLVDVADRAHDVETWVTRACQRRRTTPERIAAALALRPQVRWRRMLESMLADVACGAESPLELRHLRRVERAHGLPRGARQQRVAGGRVIWVDVDYDEYRLRVELDGRIGHVEDGRHRDRRRDNLSTVDGHATLRYGHGDVFGDPCGVAAEHARVLASRGWAGVLRPCGPRCTAAA